MENKLFTIIKNIKITSKYLIKWLLISLLIGLLVGAIAAFFLINLMKVTALQTNHNYLLFLLPISGVICAYIYDKYGANSIKGTNLIIEQANKKTNEKVYLRLIPLVLFGTLSTHLFGGSAGREGTGVQMGGAIAANLGKLLKLNDNDYKIIIICGISAGFSAIFGTPLAGTVFGLEVLTLGVIRHNALLPAFLSALFANIVAIYLGATHAHYNVGDIPTLDIEIFIKILIAGIIFGLVGLLFTKFLTIIKKYYTQLFKTPVKKAFVGGLIIIALVYLLNTREYLGLSLNMIENAFTTPSSPLSFILKMIFTVLTLGAGFQGGEVTPLFGIGATLGSSLSTLLILPIGFLTALGFIGVFNGATNTPIACFLMGLELFGFDIALYLLLICSISYVCSGNSSIYSSQEIEEDKTIF